MMTMMVKLSVALSSLFTFLLLSSLPAFGQTPPSSAVVRLNIKSEVLGQERTIIVRTPPGYDANQQRYPVLYLTDGDAYISHTSSTVEFLARNNRISELIVVGITHIDRTRELTPTLVSSESPTSGDADKFLKFIEVELIPEIEKNFRVQPYRILGGHSFGGLFAIHAMISQPELFNAYIAISPSLRWDNQLLVKRAADFFKSRAELKKTLFIALGDEPGPNGDAFKDFTKLLAGVKTRDFEWQAKQLSDEDHGSVVLLGYYFGLRQIFEGWQGARDSRTKQFVANLKYMDEHFRKLSEKFGFTIAAPESLVNLIGYQMLLAGKYDEAIAVMKSNVERYPASANVYDSLAEAYEKGNQIELAVPLYQKAVNMGQEKKDPNLPIYKTNLLLAREKLRQSELQNNPH